MRFRYAILQISYYQQQQQQQQQHHQHQQHQQQLPEAVDLHEIVTEADAPVHQHAGPAAAHWDRQHGRRVAEPAWNESVESVESIGGVEEVRIGKCL